MSFNFSEVSVSFSCFMAKFKRKTSSKGQMFSHRRGKKKLPLLRLSKNAKNSESNFIVTPFEVKTEHTEQVKVAQNELLHISVKKEEIVGKKDRVKWESQELDRLSLVFLRNLAIFTFYRLLSVQR